MDEGLVKARIEAMWTHIQSNNPGSNEVFLMAARC
jgi:hypothetical protein